jgi:serine/threonine protein kinase
MSFRAIVCIISLRRSLVGFTQVSNSRLCLTLVDHRADFYSLGSILHCLLTGKPLFGEYVRGSSMSPENALEIAAAHRTQSPAPPTAGKEPLLDELVLQLLQKTPDRRYQTGIVSVY